jgi:hypothetical protein
MGTKSYVKPICNPRVHSHLLVGLCVNINEIQSPRPKEDANVATWLVLRKNKDELEKIANKLNNELSQEDLEKIEELCNSCDDFNFL